MKKILALAALAACTTVAFAQPASAPMPAASGSMMKNDSTTKHDSMKKGHMKADTMKKGAASKPMKTDRGATPASGAM